MIQKNDLPFFFFFVLWIHLAAIFEYLIVDYYKLAVVALLVWLQKMPNENTTLVQTQLRQEKPPIASGKLNMTAKRNRGKELKGPPFISKPEVILFKV